MRKGIYDSMTARAARDIADVSALIARYSGWAQAAKWWRQQLAVAYRRRHEPQSRDYWRTDARSLVHEARVADFAMRRYQRAAEVRHGEQLGRTPHYL
jgi:hypothetical protein